ncbi:MAG: TPM domain-containing protein [Bacteroidota bacterium]
MRRLFAALALLVLTVTAVRAEIAVPPPGLVVDQAGVLTPEARTDLEEALVALRGAPHPASVAILVIDHVPDGDIETYALTVGRAWKLGRAGIDDGLLLVHAVGDHRYRFEVGPGLQGVLPDGAIGDIGRQFFVPWIKAGDPHRAYRESIRAISERLGNPAGTPVSPPPEAGAATDAPASAEEQAAPPPTDDTGFYTGLAVVVAIVVLSILLRRSFLLVTSGSAALTAGSMALFAQQMSDIVVFSLAASAFGALMVVIARHPIQALSFFFDILFSALSRSSSSSSSSSSDSSDSGSFGGGSFDGGGASGSTD